MKKMSIIFMMSLMIFIFGATPSRADKGEHHPSVKHAVRELKEAKKILAKVLLDAEGHVAKASQSVDQALQELSVVKVEPKKS